MWNQADILKDLRSYITEKEDSLLSELNIFSIMEKVSLAKWILTKLDGITWEDANSNHLARQHIFAAYHAYRDIERTRINAELTGQKPTIKTLATVRDMGQYCETLLEQIRGNKKQFLEVVIPYSIVASLRSYSLLNCLSQLHDHAKKIMLASKEKKEAKETKYPGQS